MIHTPQLWLPERLRQRREDERLLRGKGGVSRRWMPGYPCCRCWDERCKGTLYNNQYYCGWKCRTLDGTPLDGVPTKYYYEVDVGDMGFVEATLNFSNWSVVAACGECEDLANATYILEDTHAGSINCGKTYGPVYLCTVEWMYDTAPQTDEYSVEVLLRTNYRGLGGGVYNWWFEVVWRIVLTAGGYIIGWDVPDRGRTIVWRGQEREAVPEPSPFVPPDNIPNCAAILEAEGEFSLYSDSANANEEKHLPCKGGTPPASVTVRVVPVPDDP